MFTPLAARAALRRKKQHEHTLDQTIAQISTLEQQIYSIEAANINKETLDAMTKAGEAMAQIHGKLNIDKVDETMYVYCFWLLSRFGNTNMRTSGKNSENSMLLVKRLPAPSPALLSARPSTRLNWTTS